jgi:DNA (cytosine-5)-methyltransferase 1
MESRTLLDICSGIGGFSLAFKHLIGGWRTIGYVEIDPYCQEVLKQRIRDGMLDDAPIFSDLRTFDGHPYRGRVDCLTSGFPCQPFSVAGKQEGERDERNLWPYLFRVIREVRPKNIFLENVPALLTHQYFGRILGDLAESGYDTIWDCLPASSIGANHRRDRLWIMAHRRGERRQQDARGTHGHEEAHEGRTKEEANELAGHGKGDSTRDVADAKYATKPPIYRETDNNERRIIWRSSWWSTEPDVGRVAHGVPFRVDRLRALGNAVVPAVVAKAWKELT